MKKDVEKNLIDGAYKFTIDLLKNYPDYQSRSELFKQCIKDTCNLFILLGRRCDNPHPLLSEKNMDLLLKKTILSRRA